VSHSIGQKPADGKRMARDGPAVSTREIENPRGCPEMVRVLPVFAPTNPTMVLTVIFPSSIGMGRA